jgi:hypothetical protein
VARGAACVAVGEMSYVTRGAPPWVARAARQASLDAVADRLRERFGFRAFVRGRSLELLDKVPHDTYGFVLRTPCLTR